MAHRPARRRKTGQGTWIDWCGAPLPERIPTLDRTAHDQVEHDRWFHPEVKPRVVANTPRCPECQTAVCITWHIRGARAR